MMPIERGKLRYGWQGEEKTVFFAANGLTQSQGMDIFVKRENDAGGQKFSLTLHPQSEIVIHELFLYLPWQGNKDDVVFINGFQSWTQSREFAFEEKIPRLHFLVRSLLAPYGDYFFYPYSDKKGAKHSYTYTYIRNSAQRYTFLGSLSEASGYSIFEYRPSERCLFIRKDCENHTIARPYEAFSLYLTEGSEAEVFDQYQQALALPSAGGPLATGWTSWYNHYTKISEEITLTNLDVFAQKRLPIQFFQIDDGYQKAVGDWLSVNEKFPRGMAYLANEIHRHGYEAGLWLAPFVCEKKSRLFEEHPDWLLQDSTGKLVHAGYNPTWSGNFYALDFYHPGVQEYLRQVFATVLTTWGFDLVKLDFLYAVALQPRKTKTRGQIMCEALQFLRDMISPKKILGCGVPLGPAFGKMDYCRIGSDVSLAWEDKKLSLLHYRERVSTINSLLNTIHRRHLQGRVFGNDPDVFILRQENHHLTEHQKYTLFFTNWLFGGIVLTSDFLDNYGKAEWELYQSIFPLKPKKIEEVKKDKMLYEVRFRIEEISYLAFLNLGKRRKVLLPQGRFLEEKSQEVFPGATPLSLAPYETRSFKREP